MTDAATVLRDPDVRAAHGRLSRASVAFLDFAAGDPECLDRESFGSLAPQSVFTPFPLQAWPALVGPRAVAEMERVSVGVSRLVKSLPERVFGGDPEEIAWYYGLEGPEIVRSILTAPTGIEGALGRGDFLWTRHGLQCVELNMASYLGGWDAPRWARRCLEAPPVARFLEREGLKVRCRDTVRHLFEHVRHEATRRLPHAADEVNVALVVPEELDRPVRDELEADLAREHRAVLDDAGGLRGTVRLCSASQLRQGADGRLLLGEATVHAVVEAHQGATPAPVYRSFKAGRVNLYNSPAREVLSDKRNLALLSELAGSGLFDDRERELIHRHVPWTRRLVRGETTRHGGSVRLPDLALERPEDFVLKDARFASSGKGRGVHCGWLTPSAEWRRRVEDAVEDGGWILQDRVESLPFVKQHGLRGSAVHEVVWGLFVLGDRYAGAFLSVRPGGRGGVVNPLQGASGGVVLEVANDPGGEDEEAAS